jgi:hypothetical protein
MFLRIQAEQVREFLVGDRVKVVDYRFIAFGDQHIAEILGDEKESRPLRYDQKLEAQVFETNLQMALLSFLCSGHDGIVEKISAIDSTFVGEFCCLSYATDAEAEKEIRKIETVTVHIGLADKIGTILEGKDVAVEVRLSQIQKLR